MVQKEVRRKTGTYGLIGVLLAVLLVAMIYSYGVTPGILSSPSPEVTAPPNLETGSQMKTFVSYSEMQSFLSNVSSGYGGYNYEIGNGNVPTSAPVPAPQTDLAASGTNTRDYSNTNIQVAGVDEADTVKTDGSYLYTIGNNSQAVYIVDASATNARVVAKIFLNNTSITGIYLSADGNKLTVIGNAWVAYYLENRIGLAGATTMIGMPYWNSGTTFAYVYNVSNKAIPVLSRNFTISGSYVNSRMIGDYVYEIVSQSAYEQNGTVVLPAVFAGPEPSNLDPTKIYYTDTPATYYSYTTIVGLNVMNDVLTPSNLTIMMGYTGNLYVSPTNIYVTYPVYTYETLPAQTPSTMPTPLMPSDKENPTVIAPGGTVSNIMIRQSWSGTAIYRIHVSEGSLTFAAQGNVTGNVLSQYSMDENNGYFRIATSSYQYNNASEPWMGTLQNNVYVLSSDLKTVGKLENIATGETMHAARFMGTRCYLVTFQQVDPLFVIDLSQPTAPRVLGNLTIPGYSDFLQPYDATHLIGIGQDVNASIDADKVHTQGAVYYTAILGLKVSLFDVSDVANPWEIAHVVIGDRGTTSDALNDPKALLFDASHNLLVLPVDLYLINKTAQATPSPTPNMPIPSDGKITPTMPVPVPFQDTYGQFVWQGVYVFNINLNGLTVRGNITQMDNTDALLNNPSLAAISSYPWVDSNHFITRSLFIGNVLYTFSDSRVQLNSLSDLSLIAKINLN